MKLLELLCFSKRAQKYPYGGFLFRSKPDNFNYFFFNLRECAIIKKNSSQPSKIIFLRSLSGLNSHCQ